MYMIGNSLGKMYIEGALVSKCRNIALKQCSDGKETPSFETLELWKLNQTYCNP